MPRRFGSDALVGASQDKLYTFDMSRFRRKRTKSDLVITAAAGVLGLAVVLAFVGVLTYARSTEKKGDGPTAEKSKHEVTANDNGKVITFPVGVHFSVLLDEEHYPKTGLKCAPGGVVAHASDMPVAALPLYAVRFDTISPGTCTLSNKDFSATIVVVDSY